MTETTRPRVRVLVVDDDALVRRMLTEELAEDPELQVVGSCPDGAEAVAAVLADPPDIVLMDLQMPQMNGFTAIEKIRRANPRVRIIALTNLGDELTITRVLAAGGDGCLPKAARHATLVAGIKLVVHDGVAVLPSSAIASLGQRLSAASAFSLTERQLRIVKRIAAGESNQAISAAEHISLSTLKADLRGLERQLGVKGAVPLVRRAAELGLV